MKQRSAVKIKSFIEPLSTTNGTVVKRRYLDVANCAICDGCLTPTPQKLGSIYWTEDVKKNYREFFYCNKCDWRSDNNE